ncbi:coiled-coil and C2 domain-containing protein 1B isoform X1 [Bufo gargarizans]|uniref:coiled-coil and C2 domain-containing protein 1B isoform X1 n=1 Tax=Bufo gargarizans TaxID=30331 RepID=UPI001CF4BCC5|nr:coiled-coil and C2 domain-containing protein 1B isoform X1 [Bufo gargarizans]
MLGRRPGKKNAQAKGRGAAAAKELGLFVDFNPEDMMMGIPDDPDDGDLEAELAALTGAKVAPKGKPKGKAPLPMDHIEKMAQECMRDLDAEVEGDEDDLDDDDLLAELQEVVGEDVEEEEEEKASPSDVLEVTAPPQVEDTEPAPLLTSAANTLKSPSQTMSGGLVQTLEERIANYKIAITNAKQSNDSSKARRYERGLKTLESMLKASRQGKPVVEEEMPPPVACGKPTSAEASTSAAAPKEEHPSPAGTLPTEPARSQESLESREVSAPASEEHTPSQSEDDTKTLLTTRQREYKMAAVRAKQSGDLETAKEYIKIVKKFSNVLDALENGQPVDLSQMPPAPNDHNVAATPGPQPSVPATTQAASASSVLEALQQRMDRYKSAAQQAKANGDDRKARMHERIVKQYQDAIRAHKAGRQVNLAELPVPPGFPPFPGMENTEGEGSVDKALEAAHKLANANEDEDPKEDDDDDEEAQPAKKPVPQKPTQVVKPYVSPQQIETSLKTKGAGTIMSPENLPSAVQEQMEFLENRRRQYRKAALQAKQKNDLEVAKQHMRVAHVLQASIDKLKEGTLVDITKVPPPPMDEDSDFVVVEHEDSRPPQNSDDVYAQLIKLLQEQHEKCMRYSKQFTHMGNVAETTRFEKMAEDCKKNCEILHVSQAQGLDPPPYHFEDKTLKIVRVFSELSSTEMLLIIVRGINLPAPSGMAPNDLHAFVKFDFPYPSTEQPQKNKTYVVKNTNSPEYEQTFKLNINRNHRGFKRVIQAKGVKFEIFHKGVFLLKSDKQIGTASVKLDKLETQCEIREIVEVFDGRKSTGGKLEVKIRLREPLNGQDLQMVTEKWLVMDPVTRK